MAAWTATGLPLSISFLGLWSLFFFFFFAFALLSSPSLDREPGLLLFYYHQTVFEIGWLVVGILSRFLLFLWIVSALDGFSHELFLALLAAEQNF